MLNLEIKSIMKADTFSKHIIRKTVNQSFTSTTKNRIYYYCYTKK